MTQQLHDNRITALYCRLSRDDGYSGTNFSRPDFSRMIEMVEHNTISTVVVKDLSRLGREYLQTEYVIEERGSCCKRALPEWEGSFGVASLCCGIKRKLFQ